MLRQGEDKKKKIMDKNEARKAAEVMLAYADGKEIEWKDKNSSSEWVPNERIYFNWEINDYRVKPESKYRPFKDAEECWQEMQKHQPFGWIKDKEDGHYSQITSVANGLDNTISKNCGWDLEGIFKSYTFADGSVFGVKEEGV